MNRLTLSGWCVLEEATVGLLSGRTDNSLDAAGVDKQPWPRGYRGVQDLLLLNQEPPLDLVLKCWGGLLLALKWLHEQFTPPRLLLRANVDLWGLKHPWMSKTAGGTNPRSRFPSLRAFGKNGGGGVDALGGEFLARFGPGLTLFPSESPLPDDFRGDRFTAPEARPGQPVTARADVYLAAALTLANFTGGPVAAHADDVPLALDALRLARPDLPAGVLGLLESCLAADPAHRPATPEEAYSRLDREAAEQAHLLSTPWRPRTAPAVCHRRVALGEQKYREAVTSFLDVQMAHDDDLLYEELGEQLLVAAVFDGVSITDVGSGAFAAACAKEILLAELERALRQKRVKQKWPTPDTPSAEVFDWLGALAADALRASHKEIVRKVVREFGPSLRANSRTPETTATVALVLGDHAVVSWVGDSPAWLAEATGVTRLTAPTTAGLKAVCDSHNANSFHETSSPHALAETIGALVIRPEGEDASELRIVDLAVRIRQTPVRLREGVMLVLATDGVSEYLGPDKAACVAFAAENARRALADSPDNQDFVGRYFGAMWEQSHLRKSPDDRTLLVFAGQFGEPGGAPAPGLEEPPAPPEP